MGNLYLLPRIYYILNQSFIKGCSNQNLKEKKPSLQLAQLDFLTCDASQAQTTLVRVPVLKGQNHSDP